MTQAEETRGDLGEERQRVAVLIAVRTGLLKKCPVHGETYDPGQHDYQGACMTATYLVNRGDPLVAPFGGERTVLTDLLKSICASYGHDCPRCGDPTPG